MAIPEVPDKRSRDRDELLPAGGFAVTPSNTVDFPAVTGWIAVTVTGNVAVVFEDQSVLTVPMAAGVLHRIRARRVNATNTTATGIVGLY